MKYLKTFNEASMIPQKPESVRQKYPKLPGESDYQWMNRIRSERKGVNKTTNTTKTTETKPTDTKKEDVLDFIPEIKTGDKKFDKEVENVAKSYVENQQRIDPIMDEFFKELNITRSQIYNTDGTLKDSEEILELLDEKGKNATNTERLQELSKRLMSLMRPANEMYIPIIEYSLGIIGIMTICAWMRGRSRLPVYQTASPKPVKWYQKAYYWLKSKGIDLAFGMDPNREHPLIVSDRPYGRTYGVSSGDPNDRVRTVLDPRFGPEKGGKPLVTGSGTQYGYRTSVG